MRVITRVGADRIIHSKRPVSLPAFDPIEVARGTVASLSTITERTLHEIHISKIQEVLSRADLPSEVQKRAIEDINVLREAEHLGKGYWLPTPTRAVPLDDDISLLVSIAPTQELQRHFSSVRRAGLGRLVETAQVNRLPRQSLKSWRGTYDFDTPTWVRTVIESATKDFRPSIVPENLETFGVRSISRATDKGYREPAWLSVADRRVYSWNSVSLFRSRLGPNHYRYFLGKVTSSHVLLEGPEVLDNLSFQYGLASLLGEPLTVFTSVQADSIRISLPLIVPNSVKRLLSALCEVDSQRFGYVWRCHKDEGWLTVKSALEDLGSEITKYE